MRKYKYLLLGLLTVGIFLVLTWMSAARHRDFMIGSIGDSGLFMKTVSWQRGMTNIFEVDGGMPIWIPTGLGWYKSDKVMNILEQEGKLDLVDDVFFYNFGFVPEKIFINQDLESWQGWLWVDWWNFLSGALTKKEFLDTALVGEKDKLNRLIQRDLADSEILKEEIRWSVYNLTQSNGLGAFMSEKMENLGLTVIGLDSSEKVIDGPCLLVFGESGADVRGSIVLKKILSYCKTEVDGQLNPNEAELYLGDGFSKMINYDSYLGSNL